MTIKIKRVYEDYHKSDGFRILVDRLWPRVVSKEDVHVDLWLKEIAPSSELRKWFSHDPEKWNEFRTKYTNQLQGNKTAVGEIKELMKKHKNITFVYSAKEELHNNAVVLREYLEGL